LIFGVLPIGFELLNNIFSKQFNKIEIKYFREILIFLENPLGEWDFMEVIS
jgi:hypothetical protein